MAARKSEVATTEPARGPDERAAAHDFTCPTCGNAFTASGDVAVCNGLNIAADERGRAIPDENDWVQVFDTETGERVQDPDYGFIRPGHGHAPVVMQRGGER